MIQLIRSGEYVLSETFEHTKMLCLDGKNNFAWINAFELGDILVTSKKKFNPATILAIGRYRLYEVESEPDLADLQHLELFIGEGKWQGYLLPTGLPTLKDIRNRIIATKEVITKSTH